MRQLTKEQKKIIYVALIITGFLLSFWIFIYAPQSRRLVSIKERLRDADIQIAQIKGMTVGRELADALQDMDRQMNRILRLMPQKAADVISSLSGEARKLKIDIKNIKFSGRQPFASNVAGFDIEELPISISLCGEYKALGEYLYNLRNSDVVLITVRKLDINGKGEGNISLNVSLEICAFLTKEQP